MEIPLMSLIRSYKLAVVTTVATVATSAFCASTARAQDSDKPAPVAAAKTVVAPAPAAEKDGDDIDHAKVVGGVGASYFGQFNVPYGTLATTAATQLVGVRYWVSPGVALDGAFGILTASGSSKSGATTVDAPSMFAFSLKAGVPIALLGAKHYTFFIEPQLIFGSASKSTRPPGGDETKDTGMHLALGATAGAEIQFGFIGIPHLALDATIGLGLDMASGTSKTGANPEKSESSTTFGTAAFAAPWNIFVGNVAARYYF
jgi:hypothetical protein